MQAAPNLSSLLKEYFGFDSFRAHQEEIIKAVMAGQDAFALLPTGGGKSLCYQLPAVARPGLAIVVSPLIALMKDQVDSLTAAGIPATFLNSSISAAESRARISGLYQKEYKLLYVAPERVMQSAFLNDLKQWRPTLIAIDEAHCISEWGHDFRPEYRQLVQVRTLFPQIPVLALTATATERVRADIISQLRLEAPRVFVGSFNRPNLNYKIIEKASAYDQLHEILSKRPNDSGIVYCQSRKSSENLAIKLTEDDITALPYHAGMESADRGRNQEAFIRDRARVICATIAFGMGINKPNVRFVIHYDLPKNIEGYYQETGRAGRDGLPSDCIMLFSAGDVVKVRRFIDEKPPQEREIAHQQLEQIVHFAESAECRRTALLRYFGETYPETNCKSCDNCLNPKQSYDGTVAAQKYLSCVFRVKEKSGHAMGMAHIAEILAGKNNEKIRRFRHDQISTFGIGKDLPAATWSGIGRELIRLGYLRQVPEIMNAVELTTEGRAILKERKQIFLTARSEQTSEKRVEDCDTALFEELRKLCKQLADERAVPSYVIFSDVTLREIARTYPPDLHAFSRISGVGGRKLAEFGAKFIQVVLEHLKIHPRLQFESVAAAADASRKPKKLSDTARETFRLYRAGKTLEEIANVRGLKEGTIASHLEEGIFFDEAIDIDQFATKTEQQEIQKACRELGAVGLGTLKEHLKDKYPYETLRLVRAWYVKSQRAR